MPIDPTLLLIEYQNDFTSRFSYAKGSQDYILGNLSRLVRQAQAVTIKCVPQQDPVLGLRWSKSSEQHGRDKHRRGPSTPRIKGCVSGQICEALRSG
jgi:nicotinamidase-related amidase